MGLGNRIATPCNLLSHLANVGDTRSLVLHPASTTHRQLSDEQQRAACPGPDVVRLSIGIETVDDIIADIDQALAMSQKGRGPWPPFSAAMPRRPTKAEPSSSTISRTTGLGR